MNAIEQIRRQRIIAKDMYRLARRIHDEFKGTEYGTSSYFYSLAERFPYLISDPQKWMKEKSRRSVAKYWETVGKYETFAEAIEQSFADDELSRHLHVASRYFWPFLAHLLKLEEEIKGEKQEHDGNRNDISQI
ncbi:hypothetical protein [Geobacillus sp. C56-T2]|uniref:hypothetical protein n=1 Tax=Geobacillus sp. C56-T2 TaxID=600773 RepID=UPI0011A777BA|nr:hypothetical protein [Geobacillus sp. C56-T2]NNV06828.1 hypothetical protein [Geobacillus sp. MMMUD3]TWG30824.1 hypothetical protein GC56T2_2006 [Geobacillus sp. C56-T2]